MIKSKLKALHYRISSSVVLVANVEYMASWGMQISRMNERATHFKQPLNHQLGMSRCYGLLFFSKYSSGRAL